MMRQGVLGVTVSIMLPHDPTVSTVYETPMANHTLAGGVPSFCVNPMPPGRQCISCTALTKSFRIVVAEAQVCSHFTPCVFEPTGITVRVKLSGKMVTLNDIVKSPEVMCAL